MDKEKNFVEQLREVYKGIHVIPQEEFIKYEQENALNWLRVAKKRGHGLSEYEENSLQI